MVPTCRGGDPLAAETSSALGLAGRVLGADAIVG